MKIGIYGGSFDPIHIGHLIIVERFIEILNLNKCLFIPSYISPFKAEENANISAETRLEMLKLATESNPAFEIEDYEINRREISYTIDTLLYLQSKYPDSELFLLIGSDQARDFHKWKNFQDIMSIANICIAKRILNYDVNIFPFELYLNQKSKQIIKLNTPIIEISSTEIRERIKEGRSIKYMLTPSVYNYINENNIYK
ncbi:MAG: nicotinate (nicotinamide) nucleotide adenylyltransferase [Chloroherpetonaceae bacterium]|jgi:nicotinate-nucleotide adenylyltransferase|nr:nicotinate (nicotinamide) nucleotide adenylyltransferase [bacterium]